jgi:two-component system, sensor histidine kinase and response regulator
VNSCLTLEVELNLVTSFSDWLLGNSKEYNSESRLLHLAIGIAVLSIVIPIGINLSIGFSLTDNSIFIISGALLLLSFYLSRSRKMYEASMLLFLWVCWATLIVSWIIKGGLSGVTPLYFILSALLVVVLRPRWIAPVIVVTALTFVSLIILEFTDYLVVRAYPSQNVRYLDLVLTHVLIFGLLAYANLMIVNEGEFRNLLLKQEAADAHASKLEWIKLHNEVAVQKESLGEKNDELALLNEKQSKLFSIISHDLKTPLANITTSLQLLREAESSEEVAAVVLPKLERDIGLTSNMLENLLQWSSLQLRGIDLHRKRINVGQTLNETLELVSSFASFKEVVVETDIPSHLELNADEESLKLVVRNLALNAVKYSHRKNIVRVSCQAIEDYIQIDVTDSGVGISEDKLGGLFSTGNQSTEGTNNERGTGLGLLLCKMHIDSHHGRISIASNPGQGSCFTVQIPAN